MEFEKWGLIVQPRLLTYDRLRIDLERWEPGMPAPQGIIFDESSKLKTATAKRTKAAMHLADAVRAEYGWNGYVILMTGTPAPKSPVDWWSQCEVCYPGFLMEGKPEAFEWRLAFFEEQVTDQGKFWKRTGWKDDERRCNVCGKFEDDECHDTSDVFRAGEAHEHVPSKNEVAFLHKRLGGLVLPLAKKDCLDIPDKIYREIVLEPTTTIKRVAKALAASAVSAIQGLTWLRELSDGFQYRSEQCKETPVTPCPVCKGVGACEQWFEDDGEPTHTLDDGYTKKMATCQKCDGEGEVPNMVRVTKEIKSPKDQAIIDLLDECEDTGRIVLSASFRGTIDRVVKLCHKQRWDVVRVDGRGWKVLRWDGEIDRTEAMPYWKDMSNERVAFVMHPESGGMALTLTEAWMLVVVSNDFKPESRKQLLNRIHRPGMDENKGAVIVDLFHLQSDRRIVNVLRDNRRLEKMTLEEMKEMLE
jgi:SNF2 family DNA or RNA helicase